MTTASKLWQGSDTPPCLNAAEGENIFWSDFAFGFDIFMNMSETDLQLLTRYTSPRAEDAFAEIVRRHVDLVHSAVLRAGTLRFARGGRTN